MVIQPAYSGNQYKTGHIGRKEQALPRPDDAQPHAPHHHGNHDRNTTAARSGYCMAASFTGLIKQAVLQRISTCQPGNDRRQHEMCQHPRDQWVHQTTA